MYEPYKKTAEVERSGRGSRYGQEYSLHIRLNESQTTVIGELTLEDLMHLADVLNDAIIAIGEGEL